ncbi:ABC transporter substrate-binding protein [Leucobacter sp. M11]|uniref:ABC transporter substrate-binding protein n=1 Tax=Leucobacter sp. M11 TaxID=2993565 RepID=UPI002D7EA5A4|nr:ABC transporter substrate-binding protein [Leucobacter sp. M11]MEB4613369.1 ABC transporter substrate-binding protein [Leucobacter sp. M11]
MILGAALLSLTACSAPGGGSDAGSGAATEVRTVFGADPSTFAPAKGTSLDDEVGSRLLFDTLIRRDADGGFVGGLATEWEATASEASFTIRTDATCADGTAITPTVVADSLTHFADPETASSYKGAVFGPGTPTVTADDAANTVTVSLSEPWADLENGMTLSFAGIVCPAGLADLDGLAAGSVEGAFSGPYTLTKAEHGISYVFTSRDDYAAWPEFATPLTGDVPDAVSFTVVSDPGTVANQLSTGDIDYATIKNRDIERFSEDTGYRLEAVPFASHYLMFNQRDSSQFSDRALREAVAQVIDPAAFMKASTAGLGEVFPTFVNPDLQCALTDGKNLPKLDPAAGGKVLDGVKIRFVGTQLVGPNGSGNTFIQEALRAAGADVTLDNLDNSSWATKITQEPDSWDISVMVDLNVIGTATAALGKITGDPIEDGGRSFTASKNTEAVEALTQAMVADTVEGKCQSLEAAQAAVLQAVDVFPLGSGAASVISDKNTSVRTFSGMLDPATVRVEN